MDAKQFSKMIQKELKAIQRARKTAKVTSILSDFRDLKRLEKTRTRKAAVLIGSIQAKDGDVKHDRVEIANVFAEFYKELYDDVEKVLIKTDEKNILDHSTLDSITKEEVAEQLKDMKRGKGADVDGFSQTS